MTGEELGLFETGEELGALLGVADGDPVVGSPENISPPPHAAQASFAVSPPLAYPLPNCAHLSSIAYQRQLYWGPSRS